MTVEHPSLVPITICTMWRTLSGVLFLNRSGFTITTVKRLWGRNHGLSDPSLGLNGKWLKHWNPFHESETRTSWVDFLLVPLLWYKVNFILRQLVFHMEVKYLMVLSVWLRFIQYYKIQNMLRRDKVFIILLLYLRRVLTIRDRTVEYLKPP